MRHPLILVSIGMALIGLISGVLLATPASAGATQNCDIPCEPKPGSRIVNPGPLCIHTVVKDCGPGGQPTNGEPPEGSADGSCANTCCNCLRHFCFEWHCNYCDPSSCSFLFEVVTYAKNGKKRKSAGTTSGTSGAVEVVLETHCNGPVSTFEYHVGQRKGIESLHCECN